MGYRRFWKEVLLSSAPLFRVRHEHETGFFAQLRLRIHFSDDRGATLIDEPRSRAEKIDPLGGTENG
jgi:hypothetical protein